MYKKKVDPNLVVESKGWPALRQKNKVGGWQERRKTYVDLSFPFLFISFKKKNKVDLN